ncbi:retrovirus-related Pol polyprotein from transposon 17.6 [Trichonephila clavipes]|nr:retrovirus-related Pol polyprotein from transposon 17.6 [Trichonephila clavipes]
MVRKKKRASNPRKNIALTAKEIESSSSPNKISESHTSKMETMNEIKIKQEENLDADEEKLQQPITIIKNDIRFEDLQTFFQKYNLEISIQLFIRNFESTCDSFNIPKKQKILFIIKLVDGAVKTYIQSQSIPKSFYELKNNLIREFGTQVNTAEIHLQSSKTEKTSKETHIEYTGSSVNIILKNIISQIKGYHNVEYIKTKIATINGEIEVNASKTAISCILKQQKLNGNQHPIAFHSRRLRNYEINYTITELECIAIIDSLDKFHCYLHGSHFTVHSDHNALVWLKNFKNPTGRLFRWSLKASMYDFDIKYKKGSTNVEADMLTMKHNNITQFLTTSHRPQTNGKVERVNQTIITRLKCESSNSSNKDPWTKILEKVSHQYNQTPHTMTGFPPTYLMYGNLPLEISLKDNEIYPPLEEARKLAKERTEQYYKINKIRYDKKFQEADFTHKDGDLVIYEEIQYPNTRKLSPPHSGSYTVLRKCSDVLFEIDRPNALNKTDTEFVHSVRLRHFHPSENFQLNYIQQNTHNNENNIITKRNILHNTEITEFCLTRLFGEKE